MRIPFIAQVGLAGGIGFAGVLVGLNPRATSAAIQSFAPVQVSASCNIKGNISINTGEHIYHMPGQPYYAATRISPQYGERWFCSEADARAAGWRKARD